MFRRSGALIAIIAIVVVLLATVTVLAQSGSSPESPQSATAADPTATLTPASPLMEQSAVEETATPDNAEPPTASTPVPPDATAPPASTPESSSQDNAELITPLTPYTPQLPEGTAVPERQVEAPVRLLIPAIGVDTEIEWVGLDETGNMDVPSTYQTVAWYEHGPKPGMTGNAVIAGHFDSQTGPAVFYRVGDLQAGDEIIVVAHDGEELRFEVTGVEAFDANSAPGYNVFGPASSANLNLITCEGTFDPAAGQYDERLVVYSTLVTG